MGLINKRPDTTNKFREKLSRDEENLRSFPKNFVVYCGEGSRVLLVFSVKLPKQMKFAVMVSDTSI